MAERLRPGRARAWTRRVAAANDPAPVVTMTRGGPSAAVLTLIAPAAPGTAVTAAISRSSSGWCRLHVQTGGRQVSFLVSSGGDIRAG